MVRIQNLRDKETSTIKTLIILALFFASLQQFSLSIEGHGVTANYVYVLIPFVFWFTGIKRRLVKRKQVAYIVSIYIFIYFVGVPEDILFNNSAYADPIRRLASFIVFLFPLLLSYVEFKPGDIRIFKISIILAAVYYSLNSILTFVSLTSSVGVHSMKGLLGSSRYGFILCFGFFISLFSDKLIIKKWMLPQRVFICSIILLGAIFTFSRATIVSLGGGFVFFLVLLLLNKKERFRLIYYVFPLVLVVYIFTAFQSYFDVNTLAFYQARLIDPFLDSTLINNALEGDKSSPEGYRYHMLTRVLEHLAAHPFFGSCYKGIYMIYDEFGGAGSTHSQYTDVFLRTGLIGGALWLFLLYRVFRFCSHDKGLQVGLVTIIIYGLFHETFKLSQGSFVFGMLLSFSYMSASLRQRRKTSALDAEQIGGNSISREV